MNNLDIYNKYRSVPQEARKPIAGGRLNNMTDINPMWRIKTLTNEFGPCGIGWYTEIIRQWIEQSGTGEAAAFCNINLYVKIDGEWSRPIFGNGGAMFIKNENKAPFTDDEAYKKAYTDAISVACKALGIGADVYWKKDKTKYSTRADASENDADSKRGEILVEIKGIAPDEDYLERLAQKNYGCSFGKLDDEQLEKMLEFLRKKKNAADSWPSTAERRYPNGRY